MKEFFKIFGLLSIRDNYFPIQTVLEISTHPVGVGLPQTNLEF